MKTLAITTKRLPPSWSKNGTHRTIGVSEFVAIDGEGVTLPDGSHKYVLLRVGTYPPLENPDGLEWPEIFEYLYSHYRPGVAFVGFYLGYDFTQWFRSLPASRAWYLLSPEGVSKRRRIRQGRGVDPLPVEVPGWQFDIMSGRRFRLRPKSCDCRISLCKCPKGGWMYICDAGGFFQTSFVVAINPVKWPEPILSQDEFDTILEGKDRRSDAELDDDMRRYNLLENDVMARLMKRTDAGLRNLGVTLSPKQWFSPAQAAQQWMRNRCPTREEIDESVPSWFRDACRSGYIAGWFEIFMHGPIPGIVYQYDINSAYPSIAKDLPCLLHGTYTRGKGKPDKPGRYTLVRCDVTTPPKPPSDKIRYIGPMMHRNKKGEISRPINTGGWYWLHEVEASIRAGCCKVRRWIEWMDYAPCNCPPPLRELEKLYEERLRQGKNTPLGRAARLVYNCVYGKLAQNVGLPEFMNFIYSSLITSGCRAQILNAIATHPKGYKAVAQVATDAVYFTEPHPSLPISKNLGDWDADEHHNITLFKPGVYWDDQAREQIAAGDIPQFKARGVSARDMAKRLADLDNQFRKWHGSAPPLKMYLGNFRKTDALKWPSCSFVPGFAMVSAKQAIQRKKWRLAGTLMFVPVNQSSFPGKKRQDAYWDNELGVIRSQPLKNGGSAHWESQGEKFREAHRSQPYEEKFTTINPENPGSDWNEDKWGVSPDGPLDQLDMAAWMPDRRWSPDVEISDSKPEKIAEISGGSHGGRTVYIVSAKTQGNSDKS